MVLHRYKARQFCICEQERYTERVKKKAKHLRPPSVFSYNLIRFDRRIQETVRFLVKKCPWTKFLAHFYANRWLQFIKRFLCVKRWQRGF